jgi:hypothetical protein
LSFSIEEAMNKTAWAVSTLLLAACTHEVQKPPHKWTVKTSTESEKTVWVTRADGSRQCEKRRVPSPADVARQVQGAGIVVFRSRNGNDGQMHAQLCGSPTGRTVDLEISRPDLRKALALGFTTKGEGEPARAE